MTNEIALLTDLLNGTDIAKFQPQNNKQAYLAFLCGASIELPTPRTVEEALLYKLCVKGVGNGGSSAEIKLDNASYLFYCGYRLGAMDELLAALESPVRADYMFYDTNDLKEVDLSGVDWSKCTGIFNMFSGSGLERIDLSGCNFALAKGSGAFAGCSELKEILGVAFPDYRIMDDFFPKGTASNLYKLERLTFKEGVLSCGNINISYCNMDRDGAVELFNSLSDYSKVTGDDLPVQGYRTITLIGNPCVTGIKKVYTEEETSIEDINDIYRAMNKNEMNEITFTTRTGNVMTLTLEQIDEQIMDRETYLDEWEDFPVTAVLPVILDVECETLTDEDRAIAARKRWALVEA